MVAAANGQPIASAVWIGSCDVIARILTEVFDCPVVRRQDGLISSFKVSEP